VALPRHVYCNQRHRKQAKEENIDVDLVLDQKSPKAVENPDKNLGRDVSKRIKNLFAFFSSTKIHTITTVFAITLAVSRQIGEKIRHK
jgi:hypothetical protein